MENKPKVLIRGPALSQSGYGQHARFLLRSLRKHEDKIDLYLINVGWGQTGWQYEICEERDYVDGLINKTVQHLQQNEGKVQFDMSVQVTIPGEFEKLAPINIGVTAGIETNKISAEWVKRTYLMDKLIVPSQFAKESITNATYQVKDQQGNDVEINCPCPVVVCPYPALVAEPEPLNFELEYDENYLTMCQWGPRKNIEQVIVGFVEELHNEEVGLIVKASVRNQSRVDREHTFEGLKGLLATLNRKYPDKKCKVYLLHGHMTEGEMATLFTHEKVKGYLTLPHGEGFGLSTFDAAIHGLPVIAPFWSGTTEFMHAPIKQKKNKRVTTKDQPALLSVSYSLAPVQDEAAWQNVLEKHMYWCFPEMGSYKAQLRKLRKNYNDAKGVANQLQKHILEQFNPDVMYDNFAKEITSMVDFSVEEWLSSLDVEEIE